MNKEKYLTFKDYPNLKIGFSTQNFMKSMPLDVKSINEIIDYAAREGYSFIELRDPEASLLLSECKMLAKFAESRVVEIIYEINVNPLAPNFSSIFQKSLENITAFSDKGIIRTIVSNSEFSSDTTKKGWNEQELNQIVELTEYWGEIAQKHGCRFIIENANEAFFGKNKVYFGFADFFNRTKKVGLQFDTANPFQNTSREKADPRKVEEYLTTVQDRWVTTHLKSCKDGISQPVLDDNPFDFEKILSLMSAGNVTYLALELASVPDKRTCFENHSKSINYLVKKGVLTK
jgi:sugar phosphate isomerase/epimerase